MQVIGVGFGRTGTESLKLALEELGYKSFHTKELLQNTEILDMWYNNVFSKPQATLGEPDFDLLTAHGYNASTDLPVSLYYESLLEKYPNAKFILTTKSSSNAWFQSWEFLVKYTSFVPRFVPWFPNVYKFDRYNRWLVSLFHNDDSFLTVPHPILQDKQKVMQAYNDHNERVRNVIPMHQLLEFHPKEGWVPLCEFLDKPIPGMEFPHANSSAELATAMYKFILVHNGGLLLMVVVVLIMVRWIAAKRWGRRGTMGERDAQKKQE